MNISDSERLKCLRCFDFMLSTAGGMEITLTVVYITVQEASFPASLAGKHDMSYMSVIA